MNSLNALFLFEEIGVSLKYLSAVHEYFVLKHLPLYYIC